MTKRLPVIACKYSPPGILLALALYLGSLTASAQYGAPFGNSLWLGSGSFVDATHPTALTHSGSYSLAGWFRFATDPATSTQMLMEVGHINLAYKTLWQNRHNAFSQPNGIVAGYWIGGTYVTAVFDYTPPSNTWVHLVNTWDDAVKTMCLYANGVQVGSSMHAGAPSPSAGGDLFRIGAQMTSFLPTFTGFIDDMAYFNKALSAAEVSAIYAAPITASHSGLVALFNMNQTGQGGGVTVNNSSAAFGSNLNGITIGNTDKPVFSAPLQRSKGIGSGNALDFNSAGGDGHLATTSYLVPRTGSFSVEFWVYNRENMSYRRFISQGAGGDAFYIGIDNAGTGALQCGDRWLSTGATLPLNAWTHVCLTNNNGNATLYINGVQSATTTGYGISAAGTFTVFGKQYGPYGEHPNAMMDELRIWNISLTAAQVRDGMCRRYEPTDALWSNLAGYYNFDETIGFTAIDATNQDRHATMMSPAVRFAASGASIGSASAHDYVNTIKTVSLSHASGESFIATSTTGNPTGLHVYRIDTLPNTLTGTLGVGNNRKYFGVFQTGGTAPQYTAVYNYTGNPAVNAGNENVLQLYKRDNNAATSWTNAAAVQNMAANTLTCTGQNTEYILGTTGLILPIEVIAFTGVKNGNANLLTWKLAGVDELQSAVLMRSADGQRFEDIANFPAQESGIFTDRDLRGVTHWYYQLRMMSLTGAESFSRRVMLSASGDASLKIFPNPTSGVAYLSQVIEGYMITDLQGRVLLRQVGKTNEVNLGQLPTGYYMLVETGGKGMKLPIVKQ